MCFWTKKKSKKSLVHRYFFLEKTRFFTKSFYFYTDRKHSKSCFFHIFFDKPKIVWLVFRSYSLNSGLSFWRKSWKMFQIKLRISKWHRFQEFCMFLDQKEIQKELSSSVLFLEKTRFFRKSFYFYTDTKH